MNMTISIDLHKYKFTFTLYYIITYNFHHTKHPIYDIYLFKMKDLYL